MANYSSAQKNAAARAALSAMGNPAPVSTKRLTKFSPGAMGGIPPRTLATTVVTAKAVGRNKTENLQYPLNVETDQQQGHYIIFEIMQQNKAKLAGQKGVASAVSKIKEVSKEHNTEDANRVIAGGVDVMDTAAGAVAAGVKAYQASFKKQSGPNSMQVAQNATTAMPVCIALYMPPTVKVQYDADYNETTIGVGAETMNAGIKAFMDQGGGAQGIGAAAGAAAGGIFNLGNLQKQGEKLLGNVPGMEGAEAVFAINRGSVITPRMELMFEGIKRRNFSFSFTFIPKSNLEAQTVEKIVHKFKYHMASSYGNNGFGGIDGVREMDIPDFFNIRYMYRGAENGHINKIKQCVLSSCSIDYGAERYHAYEDGTPQTTQLALEFQELEVITKDYIGTSPTGGY